ncbi:SLC13 family permease [Siccirubricoccus sp. G192]|uniref:SLC13 family permease n=1 Tax=Siccirubricoccus sp. G192 TaxID=2849651 RepID=UPI001C2BB92E|nr:SLC13 family permease [Siccirubricoccus sp. G192]MBV1798264.1 SLC13 family permease [Siccirubricoccus sp. G192]
MSLDQGFAFGIIGVTVVLFVWGRLRYDLVALLALLAGVVTGVVPADRAFTGFSDDVVVIVAAALLVSAAVAKSGAVETLMRPVLPYLGTVRSQVPVLAAAVMLASVFTKNIGALAIFLPVALQLARRTGTSPSSLLMPMAFASLIGGLITMIGTSPNIIVSRVREELTGQPFGMFDYTPVGLGIALSGLVFLAFGWRLLPRGRQAAASMDSAINIEAYMTEARLPPDSPVIGQTVAELEALGEGRVTVATIIRERFRRYVPAPDWPLREDDVLLLEGEPEDLERIVARAGLRLAGETRQQAEAPPEDVGVVEAVVTGDSPLVGTTPGQARLRQRFEVSLLAVSRRGQRIAQRLNAVLFQPGDVLILKGPEAALPEALGGLRVLPLTERSIPLGRSRRSWVPIGVLGIAMGLVAFHLVPVAVAFFGASVVLLLFRALTMPEAYGAMEWPVLILLGALIPVSEAIRTTGGADLIAGWLSGAVELVPPLVALALIMVLAMAVTPFLNNAATVLMLGPIAASLAQRVGLNPDPFLMAVAIGAACDFLTPIGHQCNTLVLGPGGYRFGDYWRLGLPLSCIVLLVGVPLIALFWPLAGR